jgi:ceramide glucosyltransferase
VEIADVVVDTVPDICAGGEHFRHLVRWSRTIRICQPLGHAASLIQHGFSLLTLKVLLFGPDRRSLALLAAIWAAKAAAAAVLGAGLGRRQSLRSLWLVPLAEWFSFAAWLGAWGSSRVLWRGELFEVQAKGRLTPVGEGSARRRLAHP